jgi:queuine/archaeosine tRNA-ribosyltransferase
VSLVEWMSPKLPKDKPCHLLGIGSAFVRTVALLRCALCTTTHFSSCAAHRRSGKHRRLRGLWYRHL